jgi:hypothetical protein
MKAALEHLPLAITLAIAWAGLALVVVACWPVFREEADARRPDPAILAQLRARKRNALPTRDGAGRAGEVPSRSAGSFVQPSQPWSHGE